MAASYRSSATATTGNTPATSLTLNLPAGVVVGDALLAAICVDSAPAITPPAGWVLSRSQAEGTDLKISIYFRQATGMESASYTWSFATSQQASGTMLDYSGTSGFNPAIYSATTGSTPTTALAGLSVNNTWSGRSIYFWGTKNTIGQSTITPATGWTARVDTCTTAADFIELEVQDLTRNFPAGGITAPASTASQSVTYSAVEISIDDAHATVPLCIDELFNTSFLSGSSGTLIINTNYPNELIVIMFALETGSATVSSVSGGGLTWTQFGGITTQGGDCEVWYAVAPTILTTVSVTANFSSTVASCDYLVYGIVGADLTNITGSSAFGATATANAAASSTPQVTLTTTRNNSWVFAVSNSSNGSGLTGAGSGQRNMHNHNNGTTSSSVILMQTNATPVSGTSVTMGASSSTVTDWNIIAFEILPSFGHGLSLGGAGT